MRRRRFYLLAGLPLHLVWSNAAEVQGANHNVFIRCDPVAGCPTVIDPNPVIVRPGDTVTWTVSASCDDPGAGPCAAAHPGVPPPVGCPAGGQGHFCITVPGLGFGPVTIGPAMTSAPTGGIPVPPPFAYAYTVGGSEEIQSEILVIEGPIPTVSEWGLIALTLLCLVMGTVILARRRGGAAPVA